VKVRKWKFGGDDRLAFRCPGCGYEHVISIGEGPGPRWGYNGNQDAPTFTPSVLVKSGHYVPDYRGDCWCTFEQREGRPAPFKCGVCHSFVRDGMIQFLGDCTHELAGKTVPLPEIEG